MSATKIVPSAPTPALTALDTRLSPQAADYAAARYSDATRRAYIGAVRQFVAAVGHQSALPAAPETVANYLAALAEQGKSLSTIQLAAAAIGASHVEAELPYPDLQSRQICATRPRPHSLHCPAPSQAA